jgi:hypothetical protein
MRYLIVVDVEKDPYNEMEGEDWVPEAEKVAAEIDSSFSYGGGCYRDLDTGWRIVAAQGVMRGAE